MSKYNFDLDMDTDNSNSIILRKINSGSKVLEMGSAHGRMTKYLKETLNCDITVVEIDEESGKQASKFADSVFIGPDNGNIDLDNWYYATRGNKFDYIIFADVLEHLLFPEQALKLAAERLTDHGSIFISIPNIAHNSVIIDLINNKFTYRDTGILDRTHLKFFTHRSLKELVTSLGLIVKSEINAINQVSNTEFNNSYDELPKQISDFLKSREHGEVYQFVWELAKTQINKLSIITPVFNKWNFTKSYLDDMLKLDRASTQIIVVDNASTDETQVKMLELVKEFSNILYLRNEINTGFGSASDLGRIYATGEYIMFMNNDIKVKSNFDSWHDILIKQCVDNSIVGPTGGKVDPNNNFQFCYETEDPNIEINYMSGWCMMANKTTWDRLVAANNGNLFDTKFFCYFEDTDVGFRAKELGIKLKLIKIPVVHFGKISSKQLNTYSLYSQSRDIFMEKWKNKKI